MNAAQKVEPIRNLSQNALMWCLLEELAAGLTWEVNGCETKISKEDWKCILTSALWKETRLAAGINAAL